MDADPQADLLKYVTSSKQRLERLLQRFQWTEAGVLKQHRADNRAKAAALPLPASSTTHCVQLEATTLQQLLQLEALPAPAANFDELQANYSSSQKLLIYEHVRQLGSGGAAAADQQFEDNAGYAELVAETRREHKKQRRYRKTKPTLNEELHQLIALQMLALERHYSALIKPSKEPSRSDEKPKSHDCQRPPRRRSRSRSRRRSRDRERREERRYRRSPYKSSYKNDRYRYR